MNARRAANAMVWTAFALGVLLATAPVWRHAVFGFNPNFDQLLQLSICGGPVRQ